MTQRFDQAAAQWDADPKRVRMAEAVAGVMLRHLRLKPSQIVLDYGTGTGLIALALQPHVKHVLAADTSPGMLAALKAKVDQRGLVAVQPVLWSVEQAPEFPPVDVVVSSMALHHVPDIVLAARRFFEILAPGGKIALADLDEDGNEFHPDPKAAHHPGFNRQALQRIFEEAGFGALAFHEAHSMVRPTASGKVRAFTLFLMTGKKSELRRVK